MARALHVTKSPQAHEVIVTGALSRPIEYIVTGVREPDQLFAIAIAEYATKCIGGKLLDISEIKEIERQAMALRINPSEEMQAIVSLFEKQNIDPFGGEVERLIPRLVENLMSAHPRLKIEEARGAV